jgi:uncharacterized protein (DUF983 family)
MRKFLFACALFALASSDVSACGNGRLFGRFRERSQATASCSICQSVASHYHQAAPVVRFISAEPVRVAPSCANGQCPAR